MKFRVRMVFDGYVVEKKGWFGWKPFLGSYDWEGSGYDPCGPGPKWEIAVFKTVEEAEHGLAHFFKERLTYAVNVV